MFKKKVETDPMMRSETLKRDTEQEQGIFWVNV